MHHDESFTDLKNGGPLNELISAADAQNTSVLHDESDYSPAFLIEYHVAHIALICAVSPCNGGPVELSH